MQQVKFHITGIAPMLHHNVRLANPLEVKVEEMRQISKKRMKTRADHEALARLEWALGLYHDDDIGPYIPSKWLNAGMVKAGKKERLGDKFLASARVLEDRIPLEYDGPRDLKGMWDSKFYFQTMVMVQRARTLRTRPMFEKWEAEFTVAFDENEINRTEVIRCIQRHGEMIGLGDARPQYGRYQTELTK